MDLLHRLFPERIDNTYRGHPLAIWLFAPLDLMKLLMGVGVAGLNPWVTNRHILESVDGVPLETFPAQAASMIVFMSASWALALLVIALLGLVVLIRYRAMIPLMFLALTIEQIGRKALSSIHIVRAAGETSGLSPSVAINWALSVLLLVGLALSLLGSAKTRDAPDP